MTITYMAPNSTVSRNSHFNQTSFPRQSTLRSPTRQPPSVLRRDATARLMKEIGLMPKGSVRKRRSDSQSTLSSPNLSMSCSILCRRALLGLLVSWAISSFRQRISSAISISLDWTIFWACTRVSQTWSTVAWLPPAEHCSQISPKTYKSKGSPFSRRRSELRNCSSSCLRMVEVGAKPYLVKALLIFSMLFIIRQFNLIILEHTMGQ